MKETFIGIDELERKLLSKNIKDEIVDKNVDFEDK